MTSYSHLPNIKERLKFKPILEERSRGSSYHIRNLDVSDGDLAEVVSGPAFNINMESRTVKISYEVDFTIYEIIDDENRFINMYDFELTDAVTINGLYEPFNDTDRLKISCTSKLVVLGLPSPLRGGSTITNRKWNVIC